MERRQFNDYTLGGHIYTSLSPAAAASIASQIDFSSRNSILLPGQSAKTYEGGEGTVTGIPSSQSMTTATQSTPTPDDQAAETNPVASSPTTYSNILASSTGSALWPSNTDNLPSVDAGNDLNNNHGWGDMAGGAHIGVIVSIIIGVVLIVLFSFWFCCGGRAWWSRRHDETNNRIPLYTVRGRNTQAGVHREAEGGGDAPPVYAEVAPPEHQTIAGGMRDANEVLRLEEEAAVVSDGKTPLSEIAFEDVVLERHVSESESSGSSSRGFEQRHHAMGGDTTGHTNT